MSRGSTPNERTRKRNERRRRQKERAARGEPALVPPPPRPRSLSEAARSLRERRLRKFRQQGGVCHWFKVAKAGGAQKSHCPHPDGLMTLELGPTGKPPPDYATFEHLRRRRDGGLGKPNNVVLACRVCNTKRDAGKQLTPTKPENAAAKAMSAEALFAGLKEGTLTDAARAELYRRGLIVNWPMWSKLMAHEPPGPF